MKMHKIRTTVVGSVGSDHRFGRLILGAVLLAVVLIAAGPPEDDPNLTTVMDSETKGTFDELTPGGQRIIEDVWPQIKQQAPRQYWEAEVESIVEMLRTHEVANEEEGPPRAAGARTPVARMVTATNMYEGYTSSVTGVYVVNESLAVSVNVLGQAGNSNICSNCVSVFASVSAPNGLGSYSATGEHTAANPQGWDLTFDTLDITE